MSLLVPYNKNPKHNKKVIFIVSIVSTMITPFVFNFEQLFMLKKKCF